MKKSLLRTGLLMALGLTAAGGGLYFYQQYNQKQELARQEQQQAAFRARVAQLEAARHAKMQTENTRPLADKAMLGVLLGNYPRPASEWQSTEKAIYQKLLSSGQFDVLVVPFQVQEYALDRATRSLMTAELALSIAQGNKLRVPDPYLVARALGEGDRRLDRNEVCAFAAKIGVKKIIWTYVGHDRHNMMALSIQSQGRAASGLFDAQAILASRNFEQLSFTDQNPPIEIYQALLPEILKAIGMETPTVTAIRTDGNAGDVKLPSSPLAMVADKPDLARDALYFQLLAALTPHGSERAREHFAEKSLLAIHRLPLDATDFRLMKARALMLLGLRPAALQVLGEPHTPEEWELFAMLNGNLPDVEQYAAKIKPGVLKVIAAQDVNYLTQQYAGADKNKSLALAVSLKLPGKVWPLLTARGLADLDLWAQFDNIILKRLLDQEFPIKDYTAEGMIRGAASLADPQRLQSLLELSVINHVRKLLENNSAKWCCQDMTTHPAETDYLNLLEAIGHDDLMRRADFLTGIQGAPERTLEFMDRINSLYKGNAQFSMLRGLAQSARSEAVDEPEKSSLKEAAHLNMLNAFYWEQGQSLVSSVAYRNGAADGIKGVTAYTENFFTSDYPFHPYYPEWEQGGRPEYCIPNAEAAWRNSTSSIDKLSYLAWHFKTSKQNDKLAELYKSAEGRFAGNPAIYELWAKANLEKGNVQLAEQNYRASIKVQPKVWEAYYELGTLLVEQGRMQEADKLFLSYPGFRDSARENPVSISNNAYAAGSKFYWLGEFAHAVPLYKLATKHPTGSGGDISSRTRLKLLSGDYRGALVDSLERARHYNDSYAYRDYLGMLHAMGYSKDAWEAFNLLSRQMDSPHIWETALVGHRIERKSEAEVFAWVKQLVDQGTGKQSNRAANYLLRAAIMDRTPSKDFAAALASVALPVWNGTNSNNWTLQTNTTGYEGIYGPRVLKAPPPPAASAAASGSVPAPAPARFVAKKNPLKSHLVYFAESYRAMRTGDYAAAHTLLTEASTLYNLSIDEDGGPSYLLPYFAFASAKSGDVTAIEKYMSDYSPPEQQFDYFLARAVLVGLGGKADESIKLLKTALYKRPFTEARPLPTEYQYAEICVWLYGATGQTKYREMALDWARKNQKTQPWFAWAYAMEAKLTSNQAERKRAIAMVAYLDPESEILGKISQKEREAAIREFKGRNPFFKTNTKQAQQPAI